MFRENSSLFRVCVSLLFTNDATFFFVSTSFWGNLNEIVGSCMHAWATTDTRGKQRHFPHFNRSLSVCLFDCLFYSIFPKISDSRKRNISPSASEDAPLSRSTLVPPYSGNKTASPTPNDVGCKVPVTSIIPGPTATTLPSLGALVLSVGRYNPPAVCTSLGARWTKIRSAKGFKDRESTCVVPYAKKKKKEREETKSAGMSQSILRQTCVRSYAWIFWPWVRHY